jgi:hypothetical protein
MTIIRCTAKLLKEMGLAKAALVGSAEPSSPLAGWHANLLFIGRRKCVLFANDVTLFNFVAADVPRAQIRSLAELFTSYLSCVLHDEGMNSEFVQRTVAACAPVAFGASNNRSVLGSMSDLAFHYEILILESGGVHSADVPGIIRKLNRMPMKALGFASPAEAMAKAVQEG